MCKDMVTGRIRKWISNGRIHRKGPLEFSGNVVVINTNIALLSFDYESYKALKSLCKKEKSKTIYNKAEVKGVSQWSPNKMTKLAAIIRNLTSKKSTEKRNDGYYQRVKKLYESKKVKIRTKYASQIKENKGKMDWNIIKMKYKQVSKVDKLPDAHIMYEKICKKYGSDPLPVYMASKFLLYFNMNDKNDDEQHEKTCCFFKNDQFVYKLL